MSTAGSNLFSRRTICLAVAVAAAAAVSAAVLFSAVSPISTADVWFHLKMGEVYSTQGLWPQGDPVLFTAATRPPVQHEWLFGVFLFLLERLFGLQFLRVIHGLLVAGVMLLFVVLLKSKVKDNLLVACGTLIVVTLAWLRLNQLRPDLISIGITLLLVLLVIDPRGGPSARSIGAACLLSLVWANTHSLFFIGPTLIGVGFLGAVIASSLNASLAEGGPDHRFPPTSGRPRRLLAALAGTMLISLINPRGVAQHLTFFTSSERSAIWVVHDEWYPFNPFLPQTPYNSPDLWPLLWGVADLVFILFIVAFVLAYRDFRRAPSRERLEVLDPVGFLTGAAALGAILISFRFLWLGILPLRYASIVLGQRWSGRGRAADGLIAGTAVAIAVLFPSLGGYGVITSDIPRQLSRWIHEPYNRARCSEAAVGFLSATGVRGNLFNPYTLGGFLGYRLSPGLRIFIDGRTEHYPLQVAMDYDAVTLPSTVPVASRLEILDRYGVDLFLGLGGPAYGYRDRDTRLLLEGAPGWTPVYRTMDHAIYLRRLARNEENLRRIARYWRNLGVPFDPDRGFVPHLVIEARPDWAKREGLLPPAFDRFLRASLDPDPTLRLEALRALGNIYSTAGAYEDMLLVDRKALELAPGDNRLRQRIALTEGFLARRSLQDAAPLAPTPPATR